VLEISFSNSADEKTEFGGEAGVILSIVII